MNLILQIAHSSGIRNASYEMLFRVQRDFRRGLHLAAVPRCSSNVLSAGRYTAQQLEKKSCMSILDRQLRVERLKSKFRELCNYSAPQITSITGGIESGRMGEVQRGMQWYGASLGWESVWS